MKSLMKFKNYLLFSAIALAGCLPMSIKREDFPYSETKVKEYKYEGKSIEERFYDLNNDGIIEQYVLIKKSDNESLMIKNKNLLKKGEIPYYTDIPFTYMTDADEVQIKIRFDFFEGK